MKIGRNDPCHCGSGQKYKKCCSAKDDAARSAELAAQAAERAAAAAEAEPAAADTAKGAATRPGKVEAPRPKARTEPTPPPPRRRAI